MHIKNENITECAYLSRSIVQFILRICTLYMYENKTNICAKKTAIKVTGNSVLSAELITGIGHRQGFQS